MVTVLIGHKKGCKCPPCCPRSGKEHPMWKGNDVGYDGLHQWVERHLGSPKICWECGKTTAKVYHWANISGKYLRDLKDFKRLCVKCHSAFDHNSRPKGEKNSNAKLTEKKVIEIRKKYVPRRYSTYMLAKEFKIHRSVIGRIVNRKSWKHV